MGKLTIERWGLAGFGLPGSKVQSRGEQEISALSATVGLLWKPCSVIR